MRSCSHQAASGTTQTGVEKASTEARPGGKIVSAKLVKAEKAAIWKNPETATSSQSDRGGREMSPDTNVTANRQNVASMYRKHANQIGGTVVTPILITGQLIAQVRISSTSRTRGFGRPHLGKVPIFCDPSAGMCLMPPCHPRLEPFPQSA